MTLMKKTDGIDLSIVIPALNEEQRIGKTLHELRLFLKRDPLLRSLVCEVIVVAAKGRDNTKQEAKKQGKGIANFRVISPGKALGKGRDVKFGMKRAKGKFVIFMDADLATPLRHLPRFVKQMTAGADVVVATRNLLKHHNKFARRLLSNTGNLAFRILGGVWIEDSQCGFKMFTAKANKICFEKQTIMKWGFDMEILTIAKTHKLTIKAIRVNDWTAVEGGNFDASHTFKNGIASLRELLLIAHNRLLGRYK